MPKSTPAQDKFSVNGVALTSGTPFVYFNGANESEGSLGRVCSHDGEKVHVIYDENDHPVSQIRGDAKMMVDENSIIFKTGEASMFAFAIR